MTPAGAIAEINVVDAIADRERALLLVQVLRDALDGGMLEIVAGPRARPIDQAVGRSKPISAQRGGPCGRCGRHIRPGEKVTYRGADRSIWCSPACPAVLPRGEIADLAGQLLETLRAKEPG